MTPARSRRVAALDYARAFAILMMLQGHTVDTVLATGARAGAVYDAWSLLRGLTACLFLMLAGLVFTLATDRQWTGYATSPALIARRLGRCGFLLLLGYALHLPVSKLTYWDGVGAAQWREFLAVDVLQCVAVMLLLLQGLVAVARTPARHAAIAAVGCAAMVVLTPLMWSIDWTERLPLSLAAYLSPATGSLFPLFPWGAYILLGAVLGHLHVWLGVTRMVSFGTRILLPGGAALLALSLAGTAAPWTPFGPADYWSTSPNQFLLRSGVALLVLAAATYLSRHAPSPPYLVQALARESLMIYAVHLCLVYGSVWNDGLRQLVGPNLTVLPTLVAVAVMWGAMAALAAGWRWCKQHKPGLARWVRVAAGVLLVGKLL